MCNCYICCCCYRVGCFCVVVTFVVVADIGVGCSCLIDSFVVADIVVFLCCVVDTFVVVVMNWLVVVSVLECWYTHLQSLLTINIINL